MFNGADCYRRYIEGEETAFEELMDHYHNGLILFINKIVGNYSVAEELAADTFVELIVHKKRFLGNADFRTYIYSIGRHKAIDFVRKETRKKIVTPEELPETAADEQIEDEFIEDETRRVLHKAISRLSYDYRAAVYLIFFEELSYDDAAKVLGKNKKQIDNIIYRAKGLLKKMLSEGGDADAN